MAEIIKNREDLGHIFMDGMVPTQMDFKTLIDSVIVKRDDQFFGKWQENVGYKEGDVVLYQDSNDDLKRVGIYTFLSKNTAKKVHPEKTDCDDDCGNIKPTASCRWQLIHFDLGDDGDWQIKDPHTLYAKIYGKMGIGTSNPTAFLHLNDPSSANSQLLFNPLGTESAARLVMVNSAQSDHFPIGTQLEQSLNIEEAQWLTDAPLGFAFKKRTPPPSFSAQNQENTEEGASLVNAAQPDVLLLLIGSNAQRPRIGIGTDKPQTALEIGNIANGSTIQLDVDTDNKPQLLLLKTKDGKQFNAVQSIDNQLAVWKTNVQNGFLFTHENNNLTVSFDNNGNVGIGTATPDSKLEIRDNKGEKGKFTFEVEEAIPIMEITNILTDGEEVKMSLSVHLDSAVFLTDAAQGYAFMHTNSDDPVLALVPKTDETSGTTQFHLNLEGVSNSKGVYVQPLPNDNRSQPFTEGLKIVKNLTPYTRKVPGDNHPQMGFVFKARDAKSQLPSELLRQFPGPSYGISQNNLIATLVSAVQELEKRIVELEKKANEPKK